MASTRSDSCTPGLELQSDDTDAVHETSLPFPSSRLVVRMSEVVSALSYALDIVEGQPEGHAIRSCLIGMRLAQQLGLPDDQQSALYYALLLKDLGCSSNAAKVCYLFGADDHAVKRDFKTTLWTRYSDSAKYVARNVAPTGTLLDKAKHFAALAIAGDRGARDLVKTRCERGANIARSLGLDEETALGIRSLDEHWDGAGHPDGLKGHDIPLIARILGLAQTVEVFLSRYGIDAAFEVAAKRSGTWFDPGLVNVFKSLRDDAALWQAVTSEIPRQFIAAVEPTEQLQTADQSRLDTIAVAFSQVIDAKSPWTACHSQGVADLAVGACEVMGMDFADITRVRRAGLLHDIGKLGVSNLILDKPAKLDAQELEAMQLHPAYTLRILERVEAFHDIADLAASHHERMDGKGYFRGLDAARLPTLSRVLAVADIYEALSAKRPYRADLCAEDVAAILHKSALNGGVCPQALEALLAFVARGKFVPHRLAA